jgi:hypothetical protein
MHDNIIRFPLERRLGVGVLVLRALYHVVPRCAQMPLHELKAEIASWPLEKKQRVRRLVRERLDAGGRALGLDRPIV